MKYSRSVADTEDVLDFMLEKCIGTNLASLYLELSKFAENKVKNLRKADSVLRKGLTHLSHDESLKKELAKLERAYE